MNLVLEEKQEKSQEIQIVKDILQKIVQLMEKQEVKITQLFQKDLDQ